MKPVQVYSRMQDCKYDLFIGETARSVTNKTETDHLVSQDPFHVLYCVVYPSTAKGDIQNAALHDHAHWIPCLLSIQMP